MKFRIVNTQDSLEKIILGVESDTQKRNFEMLVACLPGDLDITYEKGSDNKFPIIFKNEQLVFDGGYPSVHELATIFEVEPDIFSQAMLTSSLHDASLSKRVGICCGVGGDVYVDPNEEN